jgi:predicted phage baseplate assembly protein
MLQLFSLDSKTFASLTDDNENLVEIEGYGDSRVVIAPLDMAAPLVSEVALIEDLSVDSVTGTTLVALKVPDGASCALSNVYDLASVHIYANVALATHGESTHETLGSGESLGINQQFCLKKLPLTYVSAMSASGAKSNLKVFVNDVLWPEVSSFCFLGPKDPGYVVRMEDDGDTWVGFGDGKTGVRLPSGSENVVASYRSGIGFQGAVAANRLTLLAKKPFGIHSVTNPIAASGAASPEKMEDAKVNAPSTVLTLGRIVSLGDYENFARNFLGIAKARAVVELEGTDSVVCLIVAPLDAKPLVSTSMLYLNLDAAVKRACAVGQKVYIKSFTPKYFDVTCTLYVDLNYSFEEVKANVKAALLGAFSFERRFFKQAVTKVDVLSVIQLVPGVIYVPASLLFLTVVVDVAGAGVEGGLENPSDDGVLFMVNPEGITLEVKH